MTFSAQRTTIVLTALMPIGVSAAAQTPAPVPPATDLKRLSLDELLQIEVTSVSRDLNLPRKDGREILREIKEDESLRLIPVVVLTTSKAEEDIVKSYPLHANCYVTKPRGLQQFLDVVKSIEDFWFTIVKLRPRQ